MKSVGGVDNKLIVPVADACGDGGSATVTAISCARPLWSRSFSGFEVSDVSLLPPETIFHISDHC